MRISMRISADSATSDTLMAKLIEVIKALLEEMPSDNDHSSRERATPKKSNDRYVRLMLRAFSLVG